MTANCAQCGRLVYVWGLHKMTVCGSCLQPEPTGFVGIATTTMPTILAEAMAKAGTNEQRGKHKSKRKAKPKRPEPMAAGTQLVFGYAEAMA